MKFGRILTAASIALAMSVPASWADTFVNGYYRSDGTYVQPHYRSDRNDSYNDNWSVRGNTNPYTGQSGTRSPTWNDHTPEYNTQNYGNPYYRR